MMREYWRGSAEAWECDEMGHMNVRYWIRHCLDGIAVLANDIGCSNALAVRATATLVPTRQHIKFIREARAGAPLFLRGGIVSLGETDITIYSEMVHTFSGEIGATFITTFAHVDAKTGKTFAFPKRVAEAANAYKIDIPAHGLPRSISLDHEIAALTPDEAAACGYHAIGFAGVRSDEVDAFDRLYPEGMIGRVSNAMPNLLAQWRQDATAEMTQIDGVARTAGAAVLEYRLDYLAWPKTGDIAAVYSGLSVVADKTITLRHLLLDPLSGAPWCVCEALAVTLDLQARKIIANPPRAKAALDAMIIKPAP
jgi:acyl-CoA thioester hydrolase